MVIQLPASSFCRCEMEVLMEDRVLESMRSWPMGNNPTEWNIGKEEVSHYQEGPPKC